MPLFGKYISILLGGKEEKHCICMSTRGGVCQECKSIAQGDELEVAARLYRKYLALARECYADDIGEGNKFENLGEK